MRGARLCIVRVQAIATRQAEERQWGAMPHTGPGLRVSCHAVSRCHVSREDVLSPENNDVSVSTVAASYITVRSSCLAM